MIFVRVFVRFCSLIILSVPWPLINPKNNNKLICIFGMGVSIYNPLLPSCYRSLFMREKTLERAQ